ncbi:MAG: hypothetical protein ACLUVG_06900 [Phocaeicola vulgatus]
MKPSARGAADKFTTLHTLPTESPQYRSASESGPKTASTLNWVCTLFDYNLSAMKEEDDYKVILLFLSSLLPLFNSTSIIKNAMNAAVGSWLKHLALNLKKDIYRDCPVCSMNTDCHYSAHPFTPVPCLFDSESRHIGQD